MGGTLMDPITTTKPLWTGVTGLYRIESVKGFLDVMIFSCLNLVCFIHVNLPEFHQYLVTTNSQHTDCTAIQYVLYTYIPLYEAY